MIFKKMEEKKKNQGILSATMPVDIKLNIKHEQKNINQTRLKQKKKITIYDNNGKYFVEHSAAYALGIINTRAIMLDKPKLVEISSDMHSRLKNSDEIDIEYVKVECKTKLKVYVDGNNYCIESSAAYALGFLTVEEFNNCENGYYYIDENILMGLKKNYETEIYSFSLANIMDDKKHK